MSDTIVILSSGDEEESEKNTKDEVQKLQTKRKIEETTESHKRLRLQPLKVGNVQNKNTQDEDEPSKPTNSEELIYDEVFTEFTGICLKLDNSPNMKAVIEKKLKKYYNLLIPEYRISEQFVTLLDRKQTEMLRSPSQRFSHLMEVVEEMNNHRTDKMPSSATKTSDEFVRKLCKAMKLLHRKIKKLEEKEVDWDDDGDSSYIQLQRYRERLIKVHTKLQELEGNTSSALRTKISFSGTQFPKVNRAIERFVNTNNEFPDYRDIYDLLKMSYEAEGINLSSGKLKSEAKVIFQNVGEQMQKRRRSEFWEAHSSFLQQQQQQQENEEEDPAEKDESLRKTLDENKKKFQESIDQIIDTFAKKSKKDQFALDEGSNSSESDALKKSNLNEDSHAEEEEEENEKEEEENEEEGKEDEEFDEGEEEENENVVESMDDILNDIEEEEEEDSVDNSFFSYVGPVSPPSHLEEEFNADSLSPLPSPGFHMGNSSKDEGNTNGDLKFQYEEYTGDVSLSEEKTLVEPSASCSKLDYEWRDEKSVSCEIKEEPNPAVLYEKQKPNKTFLKVKSLSSLQKVEHLNTPEEILLD